MPKNDLVLNVHEEQIVQNYLHGYELRILRSPSWIGRLFGGFLARFSNSAHARVFLMNRQEEILRAKGELSGDAPARGVFRIDLARINLDPVCEVSEYRFPRHRASLRGELDLLLMQIRETSESREFDSFLSTVGSLDIYFASVIDGILQNRFELVTIPTMIRRGLLSTVQWFDNSFVDQFAGQSELSYRKGGPITIGSSVSVFDILATYMGASIRVLIFGIFDFFSILRLAARRSMYGASIRHDLEIEAFVHFGEVSEAVAERAEDKAMLFKSYLSLKYRRFFEYINYPLDLLEASLFESSLNPDIPEARREAAFNAAVAISAITGNDGPLGTSQRRR